MTASLIPGYSELLDFGTGRQYPELGAGFRLAVKRDFRNLAGLFHREQILAIARDRDVIRGRSFLVWIAEPDGDFAALWPGLVGIEDVDAGSTDHCGVLRRGIFIRGRKQFPCFDVHANHVGRRQLVGTCLWPVREDDVHAVCRSW